MKSNYLVIIIHYILLNVPYYTRSVPFGSFLMNLLSRTLLQLRIKIIFPRPSLTSSPSPSFLNQSFIGLSPSELTSIYSEFKAALSKIGKNTAKSKSFIYLREVNIEGIHDERDCNDAFYAGNLNIALEPILDKKHLLIRISPKRIMI